jgi:hypothetical protein
MDRIKDKMSYLRGLAAGYQLESTSSEGKVVAGLLDVMNELVLKINELQVRLEETENYLEAVDEDLSDLEYSMYEDDDRLYLQIEDEDDEGFVRDDSDYTYEISAHDDYDRAYEIECPSCEEILFFREGKDEEGYTRYVIEPYHAEKDPVQPS